MQRVDRFVQLFLRRGVGRLISEEFAVGFDRFCIAMPPHLELRQVEIALIKLAADQFGLIGTQSERVLISSIAFSTFPSTMYTNARFWWESG